MRLDDDPSWVIVSDRNVDEWPNAGVTPLRHPAREIQLRESRRRACATQQADLIEKLLEFRNAYAVVRAA